MKKLIAAALCALSGFAYAGGQFDGVYSATFYTRTVFVSVHQNGTLILAVTLGESPTSIMFTEMNLYQVRPSTIKEWGYAMGHLSGKTARVVGSDFHDACTSTADLQFNDDGTITMTPVSAVNTAMGTSQNVNCQLLFQATMNLLPNGKNVTFTKIF